MKEEEADNDRFASMNVCHVLFLPCRTAKMLTSAVILVIELLALYVVTLIVYKFALYSLQFQTGREALVLTSDDVLAALLIDVAIFCAFMLGVMVYEVCTKKHVVLPLPDKDLQHQIWCWDYFCWPSKPPPTQDADVESLDV